MFHAPRDFKSPEYKRWRVAVYKRDFFACRMCGNKVGIQAHHIRRWADAPELRFVVSNGVTLCELCHATVKDREDEYVAFFTRLVAGTPKKAVQRDAFIRAKMAIRKNNE